MTPQGRTILPDLKARLMTSRRVSEELARAWAEHLDHAIEQGLTELARQKHPRVRGWWGRRWLDGTNGARCYICDEFIATWSSRWPMTAGAKSKIAVHRQMHIRQSLDAWHTQPEE